jgi:hypothetical protein
VAEDDELADMNVARPDDRRKRTPPISEFNAAVELLAALHDRLGNLITVVAATAGSKRPPKPRPWPRPVTAIERARNRQAKADFDDIVRLVTPHEVEPDT